MDDALEKALEGYVWKQEYEGIPVSILNKVKVHYAFCLVNYYDTKVKFRYLQNFRETGLRPENFDASSGYSYLWHALTVDFVVGIGKLYDTHDRTLSLPKLAERLSIYSKDFSQFKQYDFTKSIDLDAPHIKEAKSMRNNVFGHTNEKIFKILSRNRLSDDYAKKSLDDAFTFLSEVNGHLFLGKIVNDDSYLFDAEYNQDIIELINKNKKG